MGPVASRWWRVALPYYGALTLRVTTPNCTLHRWHSSASTQSGAWGWAESDHIAGPPSPRSPLPADGRRPAVGTGRAESLGCEEEAPPKDLLPSRGLNGMAARGQNMSAPA